MRCGAFARLARLAYASALLTASTVKAEPGQGAPPTAPVAAASGCPELPSEPRTDEERVQSAFARYECLFDRGQYAECLPVIEGACHLMDPARCLFNLATVHYALLHCETALGYYREYLDKAPYDDGRDQALSALEDLNRVCGFHDASGASPATGSVSEPSTAVLDTPNGVSTPPVVSTPQQLAASDLRPVSNHRVLAYSLLGAGAATAIASGLFAIYGQRVDADYDERLRRVGHWRDSEFDSLDANGRRYNTFALVFLGSSAALIGAGTTLLVLDARANGSLLVGSTGLPSVSYQGRF
jgi:hypothetical protein